MAYAVRISYKNEYRKSCELNRESHQKWKKYIEQVKLENIEGDLRGGILQPDMGHRFPEIDFVPEISTEFTAKEFGHFMPSVAGFTINQKVIDIIEDIEPGVHQYIRVKHLLDSGEEEPEPYYLLNVCTIVASLCMDNPNLQYKEIPQQFQEKFPYQKYTISSHYEYLSRSKDFSIPPELTLQRDKIAGRAVWWEYSYLTLYSEELVDRVNEIGGFSPMMLCLRVGEV